MTDQYTSRTALTKRLNKAHKELASVRNEVEVLRNHAKTLSAANKVLCEANEDLAKLPLLIEELETERRKRRLAEEQLTSTQGMFDDAFARAELLRVQLEEAVARGATLAANQETLEAALRIVVDATVAATASVAQNMVRLDG